MSAARGATACEKCGHPRSYHASDAAADPSFSTTPGQCYALHGKAGGPCACESFVETEVTQ